MENYPSLSEQWHHPKETGFVGQKPSKIDLHFVDNGQIVLFDRFRHLGTNGYDVILDGYFNGKKLDSIARLPRGYTLYRKRDITRVARDLKRQLKKSDYSCVKEVGIRKPLCGWDSREFLEGLEEKLRKILPEKIKVRF